MHIFSHLAQTFKQSVIVIYSDNSGTELYENSEYPIVIFL